MNRNFRRSLAHVLKHEGGFVNHPKDPGGATNKGITIATFRRYINPHGTVRDLRAITDAEVAKVYKEQYWDAVAGDLLPDGVDFAVFDFAVNSGPSRAIRHLQSAAGVEVDGKLGPLTMSAVAARVPQTLIERICDSRMGFLRSLKTWPTFEKGWTRRVNEVRAQAKAMIADKPPIEAAKPKPPKPIIPPRRSMWSVLIEAILKLFTRSK
jgi:lysozyme family protein